MLNKDMKIIPGDLFEVKVDDSKFYFLCTTVNQNESKTLNFIGYNNEPILDFLGLNVFSFEYQNSLGMDEDVNIYYSCGSKFSKATTKGAIYLNKNKEYIYKDSIRTSTDITHVARLSLDLLHEFYKVKDRCSYLIFKKNIEPQDDIFNAGSVYSYNNDHLIAMRKGIINDELYGFYLRIDNDNYSSGYKIKMKDIESYRSNNTIQAIGYVSPLYFKSIFDIYSEGGNPSLNIKEITVLYNK